MVTKIINYGIRILIIVIGILLTAGLLTPGETDPMIRIIGIIAILFGLYRLAMYRRNSEKYENNSNRTDNDNSFDDSYDYNDSDNNSNDD